MIGILLLTIRELRSRFVIVGLAVVATVLWIVLALAVNLEVVDGELEALRLFGQIQETEQEVTIIDPETGQPEVHEIRPLGDDPLVGLVVGVQQVVAALAFWVVLFLGLFATGSLVTSLQEKGQIDLVLSKPISRASVLGGRLLGVGAVVGVLVVYLLGAVWLVMSLKSGIWNGGFMLAAFGILAMFAVMYSMVTLTSVFSDSSALAQLTTLGVVIVSLIVASGGNPEVVGMIDAPWRTVYAGLYHILPKFAATYGLTARMIGEEPVDDWYPLLSSLLFGLVLYAAAFWRFQRRDF